MNQPNNNNNNDNNNNNNNNDKYEVFLTYDTSCKTLNLELLLTRIKRLGVFIQHDVEKSAIYVKGTNDFFMKAAEASNIIRDLIGGGRAPFRLRDRVMFAKADSAEFFSFSEKTLLLIKSIEMIPLERGDAGFNNDDDHENDENDASDKIKIFLCKYMNVECFAAHDKRQLMLLNDLRNEGRELRSLPLQAMRDYFGSEVSFFFAFIAFYNRTLLISSVFGLLIYIINSPILYALFGLFLSLWASFVIEQWKRKTSEYNYFWYSNEDDTSYDHYHSQAEADLLLLHHLRRKNDKSRKMRLQYLRMFGFTFLGIFLLSSFIYYSPSKSGPILQALLIPVFSFVFRRGFALRFGELNAVTCFSFELANRFGSLIYVSIFDDLIALRYQFLIVGVIHLLIPHIFCSNPFNVFNCYLELSLQFALIAFFGSVFPPLTVLVIGSNILLMRRIGKEICEGVRPIPHFAVGIGKHWERILDFVSVATVISNVAIVVFVDKQFDYILTDSFHKLFAVMVAEHLIIFGKRLATVFIPSKPKWLRNVVTPYRTQPALANPVESPVFEPYLSDMNGLLVTTVTISFFMGHLGFHLLWLPVIYICFQHIDSRTRHFWSSKISQDAMMNFKLLHHHYLNNSMVIPAAFSASLVGNKLPSSTITVGAATDAIAIATAQQKNSHINTMKNVAIGNITSNSNSNNSQQQGMMVHVESVEWLNDILAAVFTKYRHDIGSYLGTLLGNIVNQYKPATFSRLYFETFNLGNRPPRFDSWSTHHSHNDDVIAMTVNFSYLSNANVVLIAELVNFMAIPLALKNVELKGIISLEFHLVKQPPFLGKLLIQFIDKPLVDFQLEPLKTGDLMSVPGIAHSLSTLLHGVIQVLLVDKPMMIPLIPEGEIEKPPKLKITMVSGKKLKSSNTLNKVTGGVVAAATDMVMMNPYVVIRIGAIDSAPQRTTAKNGCDDPVWNETVEFNYLGACKPHPDGVLPSPQTEILHIEVYDQSLVKDSCLGTVSIPLPDILSPDGRAKRILLDLEAPPTMDEFVGKKLANIPLLSLLSPETSYSGQLCLTLQLEDEKTKKDGSGILSIKNISVSDLTSKIQPPPLPKGDPNHNHPCKLYAKLTQNGRSFSTGIVDAPLEKINVNWEGVGNAFEFDIPSLPATPLEISIVDDRSGLSFATCEIAIPPESIETSSSSSSSSSLSSSSLSSSSSLVATTSINNNNNVKYELQNCVSGRIKAQIGYHLTATTEIPPISGTLQVTVVEGRNIADSTNIITSNISPIKNLFSSMSRAEFYVQFYLGSVKASTPSVRCDKNGICRWDHPCTMPFDDIQTQTFRVTLFDLGIVNSSAIGAAILKLSDLPRGKLYDEYIAIIHPTSGVSLAEIRLQLSVIPNR